MYSLPVCKDPFLCNPLIQMFGYTKSEVFFILIGLN